MPLLARVPGGTPAVLDQPVSHLSIAPTLLELAGVTPKRTYARPSLAQSLTTGKPPAEEPQFFQFSGQIGYGYYRRGVATRRYKYIYDPEDEPELYDLEKDPLEMVNLATNPEYLEILKHLHALCRDWHRSQGDWVAFD